MPLSLCSGPARDLRGCVLSFLHSLVPWFLPSFLPPQFFYPFFFFHGELLLLKTEQCHKASPSSLFFSIASSFFFFFVEMVWVCLSHTFSKHPRLPCLMRFPRFYQPPFATTMYLPRASNSRDVYHFYKPKHSEYADVDRKLSQVRGIFSCRLFCACVVLNSSRGISGRYFL